MESTILGMMPRLGSSSMRKRGRDMSARAIESIWPSPPESVPARWAMRWRSTGKRPQTPLSISSRRLGSRSRKVPSPPPPRKQHAPLTHVPLTFPAHSLRASGARCALEARRTHPDPARRQGHPDHRPPWVTPRDRRARGAALPIVPERRRAAGSGLAAVVPTLFGVSLSQHCPGQRLSPT
jgi:hypothetical protein